MGCLKVSYSEDGGVLKWERVGCPEVRMYGCPIVRVVREGGMSYIV